MDLLIHGHIIVAAMRLQQQKGCGGREKETETVSDCCQSVQTHVSNPELTSQVLHKSVIVRVHKRERTSLYGYRWVTTAL